MKKYFCLPVVVLATACADLDSVQDASVAEDLDSTLSALSRAGSVYEQYGFSGTIQVSRSGQTLVEQYSGYADWQSGRSHDQSTVFDIASVTKHMTALVILRLQDQGKLSLDDQLVAYFDDVPEPVGQITIAQLLDHTSGLEKDPEGDFGAYPQSVRNALSQAQLGFRPGTDFEYSNLGYCVLGRIAEHVSGSSFLELLQTELWDPAGVSATLFDPAHQDNLSLGYENLERSQQPVESTYAWTDLDLWRCGAAGVQMTGPQVINWIESVFGPPSRFEALVPVLTASDGVASTQRAPYAQGIRVGHPDVDQPVFWHDGDTSGGETHAAYFPDQNFAVFVASNERIGWRDLVRDTVFHVLEGGDLDLPPNARGTGEDLDGLDLDGLRLEYRGSALVAEAMTQEGVDILTYTRIGPDEAQIWNDRGDDLADALINRNAIAFEDHVASDNQTPSERMVEIVQRIGFEPSQFEVLGTTPWRPRIFQTHIVFRGAEGESEILRFVWHPRTQQLMFVGNAPSRALISRQVRPVEVGQFVFLDHRAQSYRTVSADIGNARLETADWVSILRPQRDTVQEHTR
ncbi:serine hydrolase domain-containing protein [Maricaulis sp. D1M11]|uniref:serine hydrolase domain-containing protein n=1 Tax=Maricaulis sp. D1M11 TaxID=3076117 RepID=UPI0039B4F1E2